MNKIIYNRGSARNLTDALIETIRQAKHWIKACNLFFDDKGIREALLEAASRGVAIFILTNLHGTSAEKRMDSKSGKIKEDVQSTQSFAHAQSLSELYIAGAHISGLDGLHAKFLLTDISPGIVTSANFTYNSTSKISEIGVQVSGDEYNELEEIFDYIFVRPDKYRFSSNENHFSYELPSNPIDCNVLTRRSNVKMTLGSTDRGIGRALQNCQCYDLRDEIFDIINSAEYGEDLYLATYSLEANAKGPNGSSLYETLQQAKKRNVKLHILMRMDKKEFLKEIFVHYHSDNHAKAVLTNRRGIIFTGNLTNESFHNGFDLGVILNPNQIKDTREFINLLINDTKK